MTAFTVIVTGATKGLGREMLLAFSASGHRVIGLYAHDDGAAEALRSELQSLGSQSRVMKTDVTADASEAWSLPEIQTAGHLVLINNAWAPFAPRPFHLLEWHEFETGWNCGVKGSWQAVRAVLRPMVRTRTGTIVNILTAAVHGMPPKGFSAYATAKHGLRGLTLALAAEYRHLGIRIFSVSPGFMSTALTATWDERMVESIRQGSPGTDPAKAAQRVQQLVTDMSTPGNGEDYEV